MAKLIESPINTSLKIARSMATPSPATSAGYETVPVNRNDISNARVILKRVERLLTEKTGRSQRIARTLKKINIYFGTSTITDLTGRIWKDSRKGW
jgi:hypothetical protein